MKILFITIGTFRNPNQSGVYTDLLRMFRDNGHEVYVICSREKREGKKTELGEEYGINVLRVRTGNITKVSFLEKGLSTLLIGQQFQNAYDKYLKNISVDCILYSTPPITIASMIKKIKRKSRAFTYLMLKDIFPQNAVDLGILKKYGLLGIIYWYFRYVEKKLYKYSDMIGCMSTANEKYILMHNTEIPPKKIEVCPNTIDLVEADYFISEETYEKYNIPQDKLIFIYGGNFGRPQNVDYIVKILQNYNGNNDIHFIMCGSGTEFYKIKEESKRNQNITCVGQLPYEEYIQLLKISHVGLIFLDERFTIPNFPSRILDYLNYQLPVLLSTDIHTDIGEIIENSECGWWVRKNDKQIFFEKIFEIKKQYNNNKEYICNRGKNARKLLEQRYTTREAFSQIMQAYERYRM